MMITIEGCLSVFDEIPQKILVNVDTLQIVKYSKTEADDLPQELRHHPRKSAYSLVLCPQNGKNLPLFFSTEEEREVAARKLLGLPDPKNAIAEKACEKSFEQYLRDTLPHFSDEPKEKGSMEKDSARWSVVGPLWKMRVLRQIEMEIDKQKAHADHIGPKNLEYRISLLNCVKHILKEGLT